MQPGRPCHEGGLASDGSAGAGKVSLMLLTSLITAAEESTSAPAVSPYVVGGVALLLLLAMLSGILMFGKGREHS